MVAQSGNDERRSGEPQEMEAQVVVAQSRECVGCDCNEMGKWINGEFSLGWECQEKIGHPNGRDVQSVWVLLNVTAGRVSVVRPDVVVQFARTHDASFFEAVQCMCRI